MAKIRKNPEAGKNPEKLQKSGIFPENPEHLASLTVMPLIYTLCAVVWFIQCAMHWQELLKIHFLIGGTILIFLSEEVAIFLTYDIVNRYG